MSVTSALPWVFLLSILAFAAWWIFRPSARSRKTDFRVITASAVLALMTGGFIFWQSGFKEAEPGLTTYKDSPGEICVETSLVSVQPGTDTYLDGNDSLFGGNDDNQFGYGASVHVHDGQSQSSDINLLALNNFFGFHFFAQIKGGDGKNQRPQFDERNWVTPGIGLNTGGSCEPSSLPPECPCIGNPPPGPGNTVYPPGYCAQVCTYVSCPQARSCNGNPIIESAGGRNLALPPDCAESQGGGPAGYPPESAGGEGPGGDGSGGGDGSRSNGSGGNGSGSRDPVAVLVELPANSTLVMQAAVPFDDSNQGGPILKRVTFYFDASEWLAAPANPENIRGFCTDRDGFELSGDGVRLRGVVQNSSTHPNPCGKDGFVSLFTALQVIALDLRSPMITSGGLLSSPIWVNLGLEGAWGAHLLPGLTPFLKTINASILPSFLPQVVTGQIWFLPKKIKDAFSFPNRVRKMADELEKLRQKGVLDLRFSRKCETIHKNYTDNMQPGEKVEDHFRQLREAVDNYKRRFTGGQWAEAMWRAEGFRFKVVTAACDPMTYWHGVVFSIVLMTFRESVEQAGGWLRRWSLETAWPWLRDAVLQNLSHCTACFDDALRSLDTAPDDTPPEELESFCSEMLQNCCQAPYCTGVPACRGSSIAEACESYGNKDSQAPFLNQAIQEACRENPEECEEPLPACDEDPDGSGGGLGG